MARANCFEGGSDETNISTGNSGGASGNAFNDVGRGTGATVVYDTAQAALGSLSCRTATGGTSATAYVAYTLASVTGDYSRALLRLTSLPSAAAQPIVRYMSGANQAFRVNIKSGGALEVRDAANNVAGTTTATVSTSAGFRIEIRTVLSTTVGVVELRYWSNQHSTGSPTETLLLTGLALTASASEIRFGVGAGLANAVSVWFDNVATEGTDFFGPALISGTAAPAFIASATAAGARLVTGTAAPAFSFGTAVAGTRTVLGTSGRDSTFAAAASGLRTVLGSAAPAGSFSAAASGLRTVFGSAARAGTFAATAEGVATSSGMGVGQAEFTAGATASGQRTTFGSAARAGTFGAAAAGVRTLAGTAAASGSFSATAAGVRAVLATASAAGTFGSASVGLRTARGTAAAAGLFAAAASGSSASLGPGTLTTFAPSAALSATSPRPALAASAPRSVLAASTSP